MYFVTLQGRLLDSIRKRVQNGEVTERRLAGMSGISQPHIHNLLKGARALSPEIADRIMRTLDMSVFDLLAPEDGEAPELATSPRPKPGTRVQWIAERTRQPGWLNRAAGTVLPHGRSRGPAWPSGTN